MKRSPSKATALACAALFLSLGGVGVASVLPSGPSIYFVSHRLQPIPKRLGHITQTVRCNKGDVAVSGGYSGQEMIVTTSVWLAPQGTWKGPPVHSGWQILAVSVPGARFPSVSAEVTCERPS